MSTPAYRDLVCEVYLGDALEALRELPDESVHTCVTSPPYWGLRDYGTAIWDGGDQECDHKRRKGDRSIQSSTLGGGTKTTGHQQEGFKDRCPRCNAVRLDSQIGLEPTLAEYLATMVEVFREVRRVLRQDGTLWLNLGDCYNAYNGNAGPASKLSKTQSEVRPHLKSGHGLRTTSLKPKDLIGLPWRVAFALQEDGWWLRSDIIWAKPNPMPESVTDRPTKSHEYVFLLSKSERYFYDADAIREPLAPKTTFGTVRHDPGDGSGLVKSENYGRDVPIRRPRLKTPDEWGTSTGDGGHGSFHRNGREKGVYKRAAGLDPDQELTERQEAAFGQPGSASRRTAGINAYWDAAEAAGLIAGANKRSVWTIPTRPYPEAHFATFPEKLVEPCILAGCPEGGTVLDPFAGSGTTLAVAKRLHRRAIGIELNPEYLALIEARLTQEVLPLSFEVPA